MTRGSSSSEPLVRYAGVALFNLSGLSGPSTWAYGRPGTEYHLPVFSPCYPFTQLLHVAKIYGFGLHDSADKRRLGLVTVMDVIRRSAMVAAPCENGGSA